MEDTKLSQDAAREGYTGRAFESQDMAVFVKSPNKAVFVAPVREERRGGVRVKVGERLTRLLPVSGNEIIYYTRKGFRLATREDIIRITGANQEAADYATSLVQCPTCEQKHIVAQTDVEQFIEKRQLVRLACGHENTLNRRDVVEELMEPEPKTEGPPLYVSPKHASAKAEKA